jgi:hypothetical protein
MDGSASQTEVDFEISDNLLLVLVLIACALGGVPWVVPLLDDIVSRLSG